MALISSALAGRCQQANSRARCPASLGNWCSRSITAWVKDCEGMDCEKSIPMAASVLASGLPAREKSLPCAIICSRCSVMNRGLPSVHRRSWSITDGSGASPRSAARYSAISAWLKLLRRTVWQTVSSRRSSANARLRSIRSVLMVRRRVRRGPVAWDSFCCTRARRTKVRISAPLIVVLPSPDSLNRYSSASSINTAIDRA